MTVGGGNPGKPACWAHGYYQTWGTGPDLMENAKNAVRDMVDWLVTDQQVSLHEAYTLCSVAGDLKINETRRYPELARVGDPAARHLHLTGPRRLG